MKEQGHLDRCYLKGHAGDAANAILTAAGCNFRRILAWLRITLSLILADNDDQSQWQTNSQSGFLTADYTTERDTIASSVPLHILHLS